MNNQRVLEVLWSDFTDDSFLASSVESVIRVNIVRTAAVQLWHKSIPGLLAAPAGVSQRYISSNCIQSTGKKNAEQSSTRSEWPAQHDCSHQSLAEHMRQSVMLGIETKALRRARAFSRVSLTRLSASEGSIIPVSHKTHGA